MMLLGLSLTYVLSRQNGCVCPYAALSPTRPNPRLFDQKHRPPSYRPEFSQQEPLFVASGAPPARLADRRCSTPRQRGGSAPVQMDSGKHKLE